jgi:uncharacterized membrane protein YuzA (DUF378 family)
MCGKGGWCGCVISKFARLLVIIGGINWGLVGIGMLSGEGMMSWNLVNIIFGSSPILEAIVYVLVGVSSFVLICGCKCKKCRGCMCGVGDTCLCGGNCVNGKCEKCGGICGSVAKVESPAHRA